MIIQNNHNSKIVLAPTSHIAEDEFDGVTVSFKVNDSFVHVESHAMEVPIVEVYAPGCDPEYDDIDEATTPSISIMCDDAAYEACESFKQDGTIADAVFCESLKGIFKFRAKIPYYDDQLVYMYGFDMADGAWENTALCVIYPKEYENTDDEKLLMHALDEAANSYCERQ